MSHTLTHESEIETMHLLIGVVISLLLVGMPLVFQAQVELPPAPINLTSWVVFFVAAGGFIGLINVLITKLSINPAIAAMLKDVPSRKEFDLHVEDDKQFMVDVRSFIERHEGTGHEDQRHYSRRRGDPQ